MTSQERIADWCADWHARLDTLAAENRQRAAAENEARLWARLIGELVARALAEFMPAHKLPRRTSRGGGPPIPQKPITPREDFHAEVASQRAVLFAQTVRRNPMANLAQAMGNATLSARRDIVRAREREHAAIVTHGERMQNWPEYPTNDVISFAEGLCAALLLADPEQRAKLLLDA